MSLTREVAALIEQRGSATVDDLLPELEGFTRAQVISAMQNAAHAGLLRCDGLNTSKGYRGRGPGTYRAKPQPPRAMPPASVWDYAARAAALMPG